VVLHVRTSKGSENTAGGAVRCVSETHGRVRRAGADGPIVWRFHTGHWNKNLMKLIADQRGMFTIGVRRTAGIVAVIGRIDDDAWVDIDDYIGARAQVAETVYNQRRLVARRTLNQGTQPTLIEDWRHHAFVTSLDGDLLVVDRTHRAHAVVKLASGI
jgi:hypothetical protein